jgi:hypothetical protein
MKVRLPLAFAIASAIPFVLLSTAVALHVFHNTKVVSALLLTYAAVIISFLGGIHWGIAVVRYADNRKIATWLIAESVCTSLIAWGAIFMSDTFSQLLILTLLYTFVWAIDSMLYSADMIPLWFFNLRGIITPVVLVSLYVAYFGLV